MWNIRPPFYSGTQLEDGVKSGLHLPGFLATADDAIQLQFTSKKKKCLLLLQAAYRKLRLKLGSFNLFTQSPAIRTFLTNHQWSLWGSPVLFCSQWDLWGPAVAVISCYQLQSNRSSTSPCGRNPERPSLFCNCLLCAIINSKKQQK